MNRKTRILVVDDDPEVLELNTEVLTRAGYEVLEARTGKECLKAVKPFRPDLVLLDVVLPDRSGTDLCESIKSDPELKSTLILLASGVMTSSDYQAEGLDCGADGYITKPISNKELLARVRAMERTKEGEDALREGKDVLEQRVRERTSELSESNRLLLKEIRERKAAARALVKSEERLRFLTNHLQKIREEERAMLSREVHDKLGQLLTVIKMDAAWLEKRLPRDDEPAFERVRELTKYADDATRTVQGMSAALRPSIPEELDLVEAIRAEAGDFEKRTGIACEVHEETKIAWPGRKISGEVLRIFQETLTNIARHANAKNVLIRAGKIGKSYLLEVKDDGRGITKKEIMGPRSIGLTGMGERAGSIGGTLHITGAAGKGTTVTLMVPVAAPRKGKAKNRHSAVEGKEMN